MLKIKYKVIFIIIFSFLFGFSRCSSKLFTIENPKENDLVTIPPDLIIKFEKSKNPLWDAYLNENIIKDLFKDIDSYTKIAYGSSISKFLREGYNLFRVTVLGNESFINFNYDSKGPEVKVTSLTEIDEKINISGKVNDLHKIKSVLLNGENIQLINNTYQVSINKSELLQFYTEDNLGNIRNLIFAMPSMTLPSIIGTRITESTLALISTGFTEDFLNSFDLEAYIIANNPIYTNVITNSAGNVIMTVQVNVTSVIFGYPTFSFDLQPSYTMKVTSSIRNISVYLIASGKVYGIPYTTDILATAERIDVVPTFILYVDQFHKIRVEVINVEVYITNLNIKFGTLPDPFKSPLMKELEKLLEEEAEEAFMAVVPQWIEEILNEIAISGVIFVNNTPFTMKGDPSSIIIVEDGLNFYLNGDIYTHVTDPDVPFAPGSVYTLGDTPNLGVKDDIFTTPMTLTIGDDILNRAVFGAYKSGETSFIYETTIGELINILNTSKILSALSKYSGDTPVRFTIFPQEQPIILTKQNGIFFSMENCLCNVEILNKSQIWEPLLLIEVDLEAPVNLEITSDNMLHITLSNLIRFQLTYIEYNLDIQISEIEAESTFREIYSVLLPIISDTIPSIPIPSYAGFKYTIKEIITDGSKYDYITLHGNLTKD